MTSDELYNLINTEVLPKCFAIMKTKGQAYAGLEDKLGNFKRIAAQLGTDPKQVWATYYMKHVDAVLAYIRGEYHDSEPIEGRIHDLVNYGFLLYGLVHEEQAHK